MCMFSRWKERFQLAQRLSKGSKSCEVAETACRESKNRAAQQRAAGVACLPLFLSKCSLSEHRSLGMSTRFTRIRNSTGVLGEARSKYIAPEMGGLP